MNSREFIYEQSGHNYKPTPTITLKGLWLEELGFGAGTLLTVRCEEGKLVSSIKRQNRAGQADFAEKHRTELALYSHAERYLTEHTADRKVTLGAWKADVARLASEKDRLYDEMCGLRDEAKEADAVMRSVRRVMQREQPRKQVKSQDMEL